MYVPGDRTLDVPEDAEIVYASCTRPGHEVLETLLEYDAPITEIVSITPEMARRGSSSKYRSFAETADAHDLPIYYPQEYGMDDPADLDHFQSIDADVMIVNGWQRLVPGEILETFEYGALGNHGSAFGLPRGRGRSPLNWSLIEDLDRFLLSIIQLDPGPDSGEVVATKKFDLTTYDDIQTLYHKVTMAIEEMLFDSLGPVLREEIEYGEQRGEVTYYPKRNPEDGAIHWGNTTRDIYDLVRAVTDPYPGAFTLDDGTRVDIWEAIPFSDDFAFGVEPGTIVETFEAGDFVVATPDGTLLVREWDAEDWAPEPGVQFESRGEHDRVDRYEHRNHLTGSGAPDDV
ncbi:methionyl-tRNA formyltransferase [Salinarchaeum sp. Harcht-Bsk1]|uniref:methionyl-tRNA formyltransferase n=1 Tax=Salinarchaeum sp. Harcht-Bsk1 TaxID=1333523 RepID=UPI0011819496|nr:formyltransferase family protein [Salinarchaeum sp. Harcht-Bsk1]